jgi:hypothetical protein
MRSRLRVAVLATFVIGLVITGIGAVVAKSPEQRDQISAADRVAERYKASLDLYLASAAVEIKRQHDADQDGYPALLDLVESKIADVPRIRPGDTTSYGREHSGEYQDAGDRRTAELASLNDLESALRTQAIPVSRFIAAGKKLVALRPGTLLGDGPVLNGAPLRDRVLPAYEKARKRMKKQDVPKGSELLGLDLVTYANDIVAMTKDGAKKIDDGEAFFYRLGDRPVELYRRLATLESTIQVQIANFVNIVASIE